MGKVERRGYGVSDLCHLLLRASRECDLKMRDGAKFD
jgi:hypothetical protein